VVGVGDVSLARSAARGVDATEVSLALQAAIDGGIDLIDVAPDADSERLVGEAVRVLRARDRAVVATRVPALRDLGKHVEASLRATRLEVLPLVQLPLSPPARATSRSADELAELRARESAVWVVQMAELRGACDKLVREGKVLRWSRWLDAYAADSAAPDEADRPDASSTLDPALDWLVATSVPFSLCERGAEPLLTGCVLARRPLAGGALAGTLGPGVKLARTDDRRELPFEAIAVGVAKLAALVKREPPAARSCDAAREQLDKNVRPPHLECATVAELALRFAIDRGAIALPRLHRREHVAEALAAAAAPPLSIDVPNLDI
jgi:aryl-alcohol dehydrogenase-like predicted oxidoreductase